LPPPPPPLTPPACACARPQVKMTRKIVLKMKCKECNQVAQQALKRCKHFELGGKSKAESA
jgi:large subunit ribosomal protein L44e